MGFAFKLVVKMVERYDPDNDNDTHTDVVQTNLVPDEFGASVADKPNARYWGDAEGWHGGRKLENEPNSSKYFKGPGVKGKR